MKITKYGGNIIKYILNIEEQNTNAWTCHLFTIIFVITVYIFCHFQEIFRVGTVQIFGKKVKKIYLGRKWEQIEVKEFLLSFCAEYFAFQVAIQKYKEKDIKKNNLLLLIWVRNMVVHIEGETLFENRVLRRIFGLKGTR